MRRARAALLSGAVLAAHSVAAGSGAVDPSTVVVLLSSGSDALTTRVEAELRALGFDVKVETAEEQVDAAVLESAAREAHAVAAIHIIREEPRSEIRIADRVTGKTVLRNVTVAAGEDPVDILAERSVELLRASLLEIDLTHPSRGDVRPTDAVRAVVGTRAPPPLMPPSVSLAVGFGVELVPTLSPSFQALVSLAWTPSRLGLELMALIPVSAGQICEAQGCANVSAGVLGGGVRFLFTSYRARFQPELGAGFAGAYVHAQGVATPPFIGRVTDGGAAAAYARASLAIGLTSRLRVGVDAMVGAGLPPITIRFAGADVAQWGGPFALFVLRTELSFP